MAENYVDGTATRTVDLGPCRCPVDPRPHVNDSAEVVTRFGFGAKGQIRQAARSLGQEAGYQVGVKLAVKSWTYVTPDGSARLISPDEIAALDERAFTGWDRPDGSFQEGFIHVIDGLLDPEDPLPNASGAPSPDGRQASASPAPMTQAPASSTST